MSKYLVFNGKFLCQECKKEVETLRLYIDSGDITWMCSGKHLSKVELKKKGY